MREAVDNTDRNYVNKGMSTTYRQKVRTLLLTLPLRSLGISGRQELRLWFVKITVAFECKNLVNHN